MQTVLHFGCHAVQLLVSHVILRILPAMNLVAHPVAFGFPTFVCIRGLAELYCGVTAVTTYS